MDKETLSHYGWIVVLVMILAVLLAFATPFGTFIADGFKATYAGFDMVGTSAMDGILDATGLSQKQECGHKLNEPGDHSKKDCGHYNCDEDDCGCVPAECEIEGHYTNDGRGPHGVSIPKHGCYSGHKYTCQCEPGWEVPTNGRYQVNPNYKVNGKDVYEAGETLPCGYTPISCDKYWYDGYEYMYNVRRSIVSASNPEETHWITPGNGPYWNVIYIGESTAPGPIIAYIIEKPVQSMTYTYCGNKNINDVSNIVIPNTVKEMNHAFYGCTALTNLDGLIIPSGVTAMGDTFWGCTSLVDASGLVLEPGPHSLYMAFRRCTSLEIPPIIPTGITSLHRAFEECPNLKEPIRIPCDAKDATYPDAKHEFFHESNCSAETCRAHSGGTATCTELKKCESCEKEYGTLLPHIYIANEGAEWEEYNTSQHQKEATCSICNGAGYVYASHSLTAKENAQWEEYSATQHKKEAYCICGYESYIYASHSGGTATCKTHARCTSCQNEYGNYGPHSMSNGTCSNCGLTGLTIESAHNSYPNNQDYVVLGNWNYAGAQSVTITIVYQTESTSCDWIHLKSGDNYIDLNGNITSSSVKIGGTTMTSKTFTTTATNGSVIFRTDGSVNSYYGVQVIVTPNY